MPLKVFVHLPAFIAVQFSGKEGMICMIRGRLNRLCISLSGKKA